MLAGACDAGSEVWAVEIQKNYKQAWPRVWVQDGAIQFDPGFFTTLDDPR